MLDLVLFFTWCFAMTRSLRGRGWLCAGCGVVVAYLWLVALLGVSGALHNGQITGHAALALLFLGVAFVGGSGRPGVPGSVWASEHPRAVLVVMGVVALVAAANAFRRAARSRPELPESRRWDAMGSPFLVLGLIALLLAVMRQVMDWGVERTSTF